MQTALKLTTTVLPGKRIELATPQLLEGQRVDVFLVVSESEPPPTVRRRSVLDIVQTLPPGPRSAPTWEEVERNFQEERDAWER